MVPLTATVLTFARALSPPRAWTALLTRLSLRGDAVAAGPAGPGLPAAGPHALRIPSAPGRPYRVELLAPAARRDRRGSVDVAGHRRTRGRTLAHGRRSLPARRSPRGPGRLARRRVAGAVARGRKPDGTLALLAIGASSAAGDRRRADRGLREPRAASPRGWRVAGARRRRRAERYRSGAGKRARAAWRRRLAGAHWRHAQPSRRDRDARRGHATRGQDHRFHRCRWRRHSRRDDRRRRDRRPGNGPRRPRAR